jgi:GTP cyclohydrolase I
MHTILEPQSSANTGLQDLTREMLVRLGEDPERDGLGRTPERMERSMRYLTKGYREDPEETLLGAMFDVSYDEMVVVKDIEMFSLCEHHLLAASRRDALPAQQSPKASRAGSLLRLPPDDSSAVCVAQPPSRSGRTDEVLGLPQPPRVRRTWPA